MNDEERGPSRRGGVRRRRRAGRARTPRLDARGTAPGQDGPYEEDAGRIAAELNCYGFPVGPELVEQVMGRYLLLLADEPLDEPAARPALARRIAADLGENAPLVQRIIAEIASVLSDPDRFSDDPATEEARREQWNAAAEAIAQAVRSRGVAVTPDDVTEVVGALRRLTGDYVPPADSHDRAAVATQVASEAARPAGVVELIFDEASRLE